MEESGVRLDELNALRVAPVLAAGACASEVFAYLSKTHILSGRRSSGMSLWSPSADWLLEADEPPLSFLPSSLWLIGLGNLDRLSLGHLSRSDLEVPARQTLSCRT